MYQAKKAARSEFVPIRHRLITAPTLVVETREDSLTQWWRGKYTLAQYHERLKVLSDVRVEVVDDAGHMLHHDQPELLARLVEAFVDAQTQ